MDRTTLGASRVLLQRWMARNGRRLARRELRARFASGAYLARLSRICREMLRHAPQILASAVVTACRSGPRLPQKEHRVFELRVARAKPVPRVVPFRAASA